MFSSFNGSFSKGRRASSTKFGYKRNKLIAYYDTTDASSYSGTGTTFTDLSTSSNNGTISGGPTYSADGYFTWTSSDYIVTTDLDDQITGASPQHTVEVWIYPTGNGVVTQYCGTATPNTGYHHTGIEIVSGNLEFGLWNGTGITSTGPTEAISLNEWHQVVMTYNGTTVKGYLDGELVGSVNVTWVDPMDSASALFLVFGAADITNQGDGSIFDGRFGLMRVYRRALGARDILRNYNNDRNNWLDTDLGEWSPETDITPAYWLDASDTSSYTLSGSTLNTVTDKAGNFTVTVDGSPTRISSSLNSLNVWDFDGSESLITGSGPYTSSGNHWAIGVFQYHATDSTKDSFFSADGTRTYAVSSSQSNNTWTGEIDYDGSNSISTGTAKNDFTTSVSINTWVIVSIVFNKTGNQIFGRINGETATSSTDSYDLAMDTNATDVRMMRNRAGVKLDGRMAEYFHVAGVPGTGGTDITNVEKAEGYIAHKWGLEGNLPADHPYKSEAPGGVVRTFTSNGKWTCPPGVESVDYLVVGGGGGGGNGYDTGGGGGGSGGTVLTGTLSVTPYYTYDITVGAGGTGGADTRANRNGSDGSDSIFSTVTASGGDAGNGSRTVQRSAGDGGDAQAGSTSPQGGDGGGNAGSAVGGSGGGGGGAGGAGSNGSSGVGGAGGAGTSSSISGSAVTYGAGGAGARGNFNTTEGANGSANTGNGGGGGGAASSNSGGGGNGGSGIVIISY